MYRSTTRWTTAVAAAALIALPVAAAAQSSGTTPPQQPPTQSQPPQTQPPPMQPAPQQAQSAGQADPTVAKQHLTQARDTLSQITSMPEAAKLQGDARTQVSQLIANFNELITTQANWRASYEKVDANLTSLLGPATGEPNAASGTAGAVGTSGTTGTAGTAGTTGSTAAAAPATVDPAIKAKLAEFRTHLKAFEQSAGGTSATASEPASTTPPADQTNPPTGATPPQTTGAQPPTSAGATGTSGATPDQPKPAEAAGHAEADKHLDAIDAIIAKSKTGTLTKAQTTELKMHVDELRKLLQQQR